jgi:hypothetical protein
MPIEVVPKQGSKMSLSNPEGTKLLTPAKYYFFAKERRLMNAQKDTDILRTGDYSR